jgi:predicted site-specific integrase-resolvase
MVIRVSGVPTDPIGVVMKLIFVPCAVSVKFSAARMITAGRVERLVVTHKDRLLRFGFELIEKMVVAHGGTIEVLEDVRGTDDAELAKDVLTIITVFSARLYGRREHQHRVAA